MLSIFFYIAYFLLCFSSLYFLRKNALAILYPLIFTAQFNVTSFIKLGVTISFFELNLILVTLGILVIRYAKKQNLKEVTYFKKQDNVFGIFLICSFLSILISIIRVNLGDLSPDLSMEPVYFARSIMSLNKFFFYFPCFYVIRSYLMEVYDMDTLKDGFLKAMAWSGLLPTLALIMQFFSLGFVLIHNNPSFAEAFRLVDYGGGIRPVGLTNEASFYVYQLFFSTLGLYYGWQKLIISNKVYYTLISIYTFGVIASISRTGLLIFALFFVIVWLRNNKIYTMKGFLAMVKYMPIVVIALVVLSSLNIGGFNLADRILSSFEQQADLSTLERYGSAEALFKLFLSKSLIVGIGIYNYQYYINGYLPDYMDVFYYAKGTAPASFNFVFQIVVEFGLVITLIFFYTIFKSIYNTINDQFFKDWFLFLLIFSFSFQTLNFAIPFLIFFYPSKRMHEHFICIR